MKSAVLSLPFLILAAMACSQSEPASHEMPLSPEPVTREVTSPPPANAAELRYLVDPETNAVHRTLPPEVLADVKAQLQASGRTRELGELEQLYDFETGKVKSEARADAAEVALRSLHGGGR